jgi:hypothetical protein
MYNGKIDARPVLVDGGFNHFDTATTLLLADRFHCMNSTGGAYLPQCVSVVDHLRLCWQSCLNTTLRLKGV